MNGTAQCWGANYYGQLGSNSTVDRATPADVRDFWGSVQGVVALSSGNDHSCVVFAGGGMSCWGDNYYDQLGDGTQTQRNVATPIASLSLVSRAAAGWYDSCARRANGTAWCWGANYYGEVGDGTQSTRSSPVQLTAFP